MLLIDAVALLDIFKQNSITEIITIGDKTIRQHVYDAPIIDAVPVVRCKDCRWYDSAFYTCTKCCVCVNRDFYCADGERSK